MNDSHYNSTDIFISIWACHSSRDGIIINLKYLSKLQSTQAVLLLLEIKQMFCNVVTTFFPSKQFHRLLVSDDCV